MGCYAGSGAGLPVKLSLSVDSLRGATPTGNCLLLFECLHGHFHFLGVFELLRLLVYFVFFVFGDIYQLAQVALA